MKIVILAAVSALALAAPVFAQMRSGAAEPNRGGRGSMNSQPMNAQPMDQRQSGDMGRGRNDPAMSGHGSGMDHVGGEHDMDRGRADHAGGYGRHCRTVGHHHHRVRRCY